MGCRAQQQSCKVLSNLLYGAIYNTQPQLDNPASLASETKAGLSSHSHLDLIGILPLWGRGLRLCWGLRASPSSACNHPFPAGEVSTLYVCAHVCACVFNH